MGEVITTCDCNYVNRVVQEAPAINTSKIRHHVTCKAHLGDGQ